MTIIGTDPETHSLLEGVDDSLPTQGELVFALVDGQPVTEVPNDLYIPPDALLVFLEAFEGPLDLLLYLIKRQNLDFRNTSKLISPFVTWAGPSK